MKKDQSAAIVLEHVTKRFGKTTAVDDLSIEILEGHTTGLLGPNGAGKTTTIQMILDTVTPTKGSIRIFGQELSRNRESVLSLVNFSSPYVALPGNLTVKENLIVFAGLYGIKNAKKTITELADFFDIIDLLAKMTSTLSTGQLTRVNLTKALLNNPRMLLLDEPTSSLDPDIADKTRKLLKHIQKERNLTMLYTSHNMDEIEEMCDRVLFINHGRLVADDSPKDLMKRYNTTDLTHVFLAIARGGEGEKI